MGDPPGVILVIMWISGAVANLEGRISRAQGHASAAMDAALTDCEIRTRLSFCR
jgi:hypothetical protein